MERFDTLSSVAVPLLRDNVDTDAIIPSREMTSVAKTGLADGLFAGWRYRTLGGRDPDPAFVLNDPAFAGATILLGGANFGCGSSREHAAWALAEYGFRAIIAASFNPIFRGNCVRNGIVPVALDAAALAAAPQPLTIDLAAQTVTDAAGTAHGFAIDAEAKAMLLGGLDAIDLTLRDRPAIDAFRTADRLLRPWIYL
ncbi:3-isopropylmalate dehydratase small subunit [Sphingomonas sp. AAP5]|uniref:3-isopropylmalate dehydratase small subunit n=1 Tax=Sphingomonas sp. AAP5 TaxID=1523415 RepID=UPI00105738F0|nr:3-isopropylmalate dehydratase small subunit [Sphingomonas sp. AAP5]QBM75121.1 3-isopropylmalate dehydratase small subunit [Sphingomonas sp. AAP5]